MESRLKLLGHPVHPMLIVYPLGLLSTAVIFDGLYTITGRRSLSTFSFWALVSGLVGAVPAAAFGLIDWRGIPRAARAKRIGLWHGTGNVAVVGLFGLSLLSRWSRPAYRPNPLPLLFGLMGAGLAVVTAWLGGELVYRLGVGIDDDARLNASSSFADAGVVETTLNN